MEPEDLHDICKRLALLEKDARELREDLERLMLDEKLDVHMVQARLMR